MPLLTELTGAHLLAESAPRRFTGHDLLRAYATDRARVDEPAPARDAAVGRLVRHFVVTVRAAVSVLYPGEPGTGPTDGFTGPVAARGWLDAERANLVAFVRHGQPAHVIALASAAFHYFDGGHYLEAHELHRRALTAARTVGDRAAEAAAEHHLGVTCRRFSRYPEAAGHHQRPSRSAATSATAPVRSRAGRARRRVLATR
ncbi:hypothetical protein ACFQX7_29905 [Luedemannella flava]